MMENNGSLFSDRPALKALIFYVLGIIASLFFAANAHIICFLCVIFLFATLIALRKDRKKIAGWFVLLALIFLGWFRADLAEGPFGANHISNLAQVQTNVQVAGKIIEEPDTRPDKVYLAVEADSVKLGKMWVPTFGKLRAKIQDGGVFFDHGDYIILKGYLYKPDKPRNPKGFDYQTYLKNKGIYAGMSVWNCSSVELIHKRKTVFSSLITPLRNWLLGKAKENLNSLSAAILSGFILGERSDISLQHQKLFKDTGTLHLMAVSGSNVALVIAFFGLPLIFLRMARPVKASLLILVVVLFALLTRLEPSVLRASIIAIVGLLAWGWIRKPDPINLLAFAGLAMLLWQPLKLFDVGLQLSFAATFGIVYALPDLLGKISSLRGFKIKWLAWIITLALTTFAAQAAVMPLLAKYFNVVPLAGIFANLPVGALAGIVSYIGMAYFLVCVFGGWFSYPIAKVLEWIIGGIVELLKFFASLPYATVKVPSFDWWSLFLYWTLLYMIFEAVFKKRVSKKGMICALVFFNLVILTGVVKEKPCESLEFLDVGKNRAWIYRSFLGQTIAGYDCWRAQNDVESVLIPHILNFCDGKLDFLFTFTEDSSEVTQLVSAFRPQVISMGDLRRKSENPQGRLMEKSYLVDELTDVPIKIVWLKSDNIAEGGKLPPALEIETKRGGFVLCGWVKAERFAEYLSCVKPTVLELPCHMFAEKSLWESLHKTKPKMIVFSPSRRLTALPRSLCLPSWAKERVFSTSIAGGFKIEIIEDGIRVGTMKSLKEKDK